MKILFLVFLVLIPVATHSAEEKIETKVRSWEFRSESSQTIMTIYPDGRVELGKDVTLDQASRTFWRYVVEPPAVRCDWKAPK